jgi:hypothetical protein
MMAPAGLKKTALPLLLALVLSGCGIAASYRPADQKTLRDYSPSSDFRKKVGVLALTNTTLFTSDQVTEPFMTAFLSAMAATAPSAILVEPGGGDVPPFLSKPPRIADGNMNVFQLARLGRSQGMNAIVSPVLMNIRVRKRDTGFWFFKDVAYSLQIQTAAALYDTITGSRLALGILTDEVDIDEDQANIINNGNEVEVDELVEVAENMGEKLGERMGSAIDESQWVASVAAIAEGACVITAGSDEGIQPGDLFSVLDGSATLTGKDGQRYIVPGVKIGEITISRVLPGKAFGTPVSGDPPPVGSIVIPGP